MPNNYYSHLFKIFIISSLNLIVLSNKIYSQSLSAEKIYEKVKDAVVVIYAYDDSDELASQGSGVVLNDKGYVVTNYHVLSGCERLEIIHGEEIIPYVDIIGIDVEKDILILKIDEKKFPSIKIGDVKSLKVGQRIYAIGSPMGFENTISEGIISGLRSYEELSENYIQITASISPGSSGGAIVNDKGELIGISTSTIEEGQNLNFAIPIDDVLSVEISSYSKNDAYKEFELFYKGNGAAEKGNYQDAIKYFTSYLKKFPNDAGAYFNRGNAKYELKDYNGAIEDYNNTIKINPNFAGAYINSGNVKYGLQYYRDAMQDYAKAIEINPNDALAYLKHGNVKSKLEDYRGAIQDYTKAVEINPNYFEAYYNRGITKYNLQDYRGAIKDYDKVIEINPNDADAYYNRGNVKSKLEDYRGAIQDYTKVIEIKPSDSGAYYNRGDAKIKLQDYRGAIQDFNKAIEINPNYAIAYINRGFAKAFLGDKSGACLDWSKAGELGNDDAYDFIREFCN